LAAFHQELSQAVHLIPPVFMATCLNPLMTKPICYISNQSVPRCKHSTSVKRTNLLMTYKRKSLFVLRATQNT
jgi:hypothetical protein